MRDSLMKSVQLAIEIATRYCVLMVCWGWERGCYQVLCAYGVLGMGEGLLPGIVCLWYVGDGRGVATRYCVLMVCWGWERGCYQVLCAYGVLGMGEGVLPGIVCLWCVGEGEGLLPGIVCLWCVGDVRGVATRYCVLMVFWGCERGCYQVLCAYGVLGMGEGSL